MIDHAEERLAYPLVHTLSSPYRARERFEDQDVHVWSARLDLPAGRVSQLERNLSEEERSRSAHRRLSRALLRHILAGYVGSDPGELCFVDGTDRKPHLAGLPGGEPLHFNLSHSGDLLLTVVARIADVGVDLECIRPVARAETVARRAFTAGERARIDALAPELRPLAFFNCWTRKEACVKALGQGVWSAFGRWEVSVEPGEPARVLVADGDADGAAHWSLFHLEPAPGYVGALAVRGAAGSVAAWTLDPHLVSE